MTYALPSRSLITFARAGALATNSVSNPGYPFGSIAPYDVDESGRVVIYISLIAEHYKNLIRDPKASLLVSDPSSIDDPQAGARATVLTVFEPVPAAEAQAVQERYERRFPKSINYEIAHNFVFMRGMPTKVRWIGGFGEIGWVSGEKYAAEAFDPVAYAGWGMVSHMNDDHQDALRDLVPEKAPDSSRVFYRMTTIDRAGFQIAVRLGDETKMHRLDFPEPLNSPDEARGAIIRLLKEARAAAS